MGGGNGGYGVYFWVVRTVTSSDDGVVVMGAAGGKRVMLVALYTVGIFYWLDGRGIVQVPSGDGEGRKGPPPSTAVISTSRCPHNTPT